MGFEPPFRLNASRPGAVETSEGRSRGDWMRPIQFHPPFEHPCCFDSGRFAALGHSAPSGRVFRLGAPHCVSGLGVRLDLHRISPCPGFEVFRYCSTRLDCLGGVRLGAPHCVSGFGVRLDLHRISPCPGFLGVSLLFYSIGRLGRLSIRYPTLRFRLWYSSSPSSDCPLSWDFCRVGTAFSNDSDSMGSA